MERDPEKLLVTADMHYGLYPLGDVGNRRLAEYVCASDADAFAICGDVGDADLDSFSSALALFEGFKGLKLLVPGNHDLWSAAAPTAEKYRDILPARAADQGFRMLDVGPATIGRTGFIGNIGWYDYSFRNKSLNVPLGQYPRKELPGVCIWNDGRFMDWDVTDTEFTDKCLRKLQAAYRSVEPSVHTVVAILHVLPYADMLYGPASAAFEFSRAYLGSERFGRLFDDMPKVRYVFCGHRHGQAVHAPEGRTDRSGPAGGSGPAAFCVGSDYRKKRLIELTLPSGEHATHVFASEEEKKKEAPVAEETE
jgi:predicted phosphohydrolase